MIGPSGIYGTGNVVDESEGAELRLVQPDSGRWAVHYIPATTEIEHAVSLDDRFALPRSPILLVEGDLLTGIVTTYPLNTNANSRGFLKPKYQQIRTVTFEEIHSISIIEQAAPADVEEVMNMMLGLPPGFVKNPYFGLGLNYDIIHLVHAIERLIGIKDLRICRQTKAGSPVVEGSSYVISTRLFDVARRTINRIHDRALGIAQGEKHIFAHNAILTALDAVAYPEQNPPYRKGSISRAIGKGVGRETKLSWVDQELIVRLTRTAVDSLTREKPAEMLALSQEIEVVSLEGLIERLSQRFKKKLREAEWQTFFVENPFVLRLAFGLPVMMLGGQISVGGRRFGGSGDKISDFGDKISDFAVKAAASGNLALVEIKTPETPLLETSPYRGELYAPGRELSGAVNQVLEQRYNLQQNINNLKVASRLYDVETYAVQCLVVAGRTPASPATLKSLELFRNGLKSVTIVTFDELLAKLEQLLEFLKGTT